MSNTAVASDDLPILDEQERLLRFTAFDTETAWRLGNLLRDALLARGASDSGGSVEIEAFGHLYFACATPGAKPNQPDWIRRKRNTVHRLGRSSYAVGRELERDGQTLEQRHGLAESDFAAHGGAFPIRLEDGAMIGTVVLSGRPQREDHNMVVDALATLLGCETPRLR
jgi:uncharacterized protein (UPF0303 family)